MVHVGGYGPHHVSRIEFAKRLKAIRDVVSDRHYQAIVALLLSPEQVPAIERAMDGLSEEDEFAVMTRLMGTASLLVPLVHSPIFGRDFTVPDFLGLFDVTLSEDGGVQPHNGLFKCLIEVKSTIREEFHFSGKALARLRFAAQQLGYPLLFAVRFVRYSDYAVWVIVRDDGESSSVRVDMRHFTTGLREHLWNDRFYVIKPGVSIGYVYSQDPETTNLADADFDYLERVVIRDGGKEIVAEGDDAILAGHFLQAFNLESQETVQQRNQLVEWFHPKSRFATVVDMLYNLNRIIADENGDTIYNPPEILAKADQMDELPLLERDQIEPIAHSLVEQGILSAMSYREFESAMNGSSDS